MMVNWKKCGASAVTILIWQATWLSVSAANYYSGVQSSIPWPGGIIRYAYAASVTTNQRTAFEAAAHDWELAANVHFVPRTFENDYIIVTNLDGAPFPYRSTGAPQIFFPLGWHRGQINHEIGHMLGFTHEMAATNRDTFVTIYTNNLSPSEQWMAFYDPNSIHFGDYDFDSVMTGTGGTLLFKGGNIVPTGKADPKPQYQLALIGHNYADLLSKWDRAGLAALYGPGPSLGPVVTNTTDAGVGSLRAAIYYANDHPGTTITFDIPTSDPGYDSSSGTFVIKVIDHLPTIKAIGTIVDGSTQPGFSGTPRIIVDGSWNNTAQLGFEVNGFKILAANCQIKAITVNGFSGAGISIIGPLVTNVLIQGCLVGTDGVGNSARANGNGIIIEQGSRDDLVGGNMPGEGNLISGNAGSGVSLVDAGTTGNLLRGNLIGTTRNGSIALPNGYAGVLVGEGASTNDLGGSMLNARNTISGNAAYGVVMFGLTTSGNRIRGNYIGTDMNGAAAINNWAGIGLYSGTIGNILGGAESLARNVISGNSAYGIIIAGANTSGNVVQGNFIGTRADGSNSLGNGFNGIFIYDDAHHNIVGLSTNGNGVGNTVAFSASDGVRLDGTNSTGNVIRGNAIHNNVGLGIELGGPSFFGVTPNDFGDFDAGPNRLQNYPVLTSASAIASTTKVTGNLSSTANRQFIIDLYRSLSSDPTGYGEGQLHLGSTNVTTDGSGNGGFAAQFLGNFAGQYITATATDAASGDTSEFSFALQATNALPPFEFAGPYSLNQNSFNFYLALETNRAYRIQATTNLGAKPIEWVEIANFTATSWLMQFTDRSATNYGARFYRVTSP